MTASQRSSHLFLSLLQARVGASLVSRLGGLPPEDLLEMAPVELASRVRITERAAREYGRLRATFAPDAIYSELARRNLCVLTLADAGYPGRLREIPDPPPALFVSGEVPDVPAVALVGSRKASGTGLECARALGGALGERGVCVVSGLALGVDAAAHEGALEAGGPTVGVLGFGKTSSIPETTGLCFGRWRVPGHLYRSTTWGSRRSGGGFRRAIESSQASATP